MKLTKEEVVLELKGKQIRLVQGEAEELRDLLNREFPVKNPSLQDLLTELNNQEEDWLDLKDWDFTQKDYKFGPVTCSIKIN